MSAWHQVRRFAAGAAAAIVAALAQSKGIPVVWAVILGICAAIIFASLIFPLLWRPPKPASEEAGRDDVVGEKPRRKKR